VRPGIAGHADIEDYSWTERPEPEPEVSMPLGQRVGAGVLLLAGVALGVVSLSQNLTYTYAFGRTVVSGEQMAVLGRRNRRPHTDSS
jgi:hypothetical protein